MAEMKVFVINLDEQEKDTGCAILHTIGTVQIWKKHQNISYVCMADFMNTMSERK